MMGSVSINTSLANIWRSWYLFRRGKKRTLELDNFQYYLEKNISTLHKEIDQGTYIHGPYSKFVVNDNKRREISVAGIRDRIVHRLLYEYLVFIYDKTFIFDAWSCRKNKGLVGAIERAQSFLSSYPRGFVWRADIKKFFDTVSRERLFQILSRKVLDPRAMRLIQRVISSYESAGAERERERESKKSFGPGTPRGIPIGNLTSQVFANIYLNELDRFVKHILKPKAYLRYGDDFLIVTENFDELVKIREKVIDFVNQRLGLNINSKNDILLKVKHGVHFLGVNIFPKGRTLKDRNWRRISENLNLKNAASYLGLVKQHGNYKRIKEINWRIITEIESNNI